MIKALQPKYGYTDNGNKYQKFSLGKKICTAVAVTTSALTVSKATKNGGFKMATDNFVRACSEAGAQIPLKKAKAVIGASYALGAAINVGLGTLGGHIIDSIANKVSQVKADKAAKTQE